MLFDLEHIKLMLYLAPALLLSLTVHEFAHARTALAFGDPTAKLMGRCSLNPLVHLDPMGTLVLLVTGMIGWAKPVPVNPANLRPRRLGDIVVSLAGPLSNLSLAILSVLAIRLWTYLSVTTSLPRMPEIVSTLSLYLIVANIGLFTFNLIPLFPLDGHHVIREILPTTDQIRYMTWQLRYGRFLLMALIFGPTLLSTLSRKPMFDPIGMLYQWVIGTFLHLMF